MIANPEAYDELNQIVIEKIIKDQTSVSVFFGYNDIFLGCSKVYRLESGGEVSIDMKNLVCFTLCLDEADVHISLTANGPEIHL